MDGKKHARIAWNASQIRRNFHACCIKNLLGRTLLLSPTIFPDHHRPCKNIWHASPGMLPAKERAQIPCGFQQINMCRHVRHACAAGTSNFRALASTVTRPFGRTENVHTSCWRDAQGRMLLYCQRVTFSSTKSDYSQNVRKAMLCTMTFRGAIGGLSRNIKYHPGELVVSHRSHVVVPALFSVLCDHTHSSNYSWVSPWETVMHASSGKLVPNKKYWPIPCKSLQARTDSGAYSHACINIAPACLVRTQNDLSNVRQDNAML
jgi:hypothetical protein